MTATYETRAGERFSATLRLKYMTRRVARLPNRAEYENIAVFFKPGPMSWRWNATTTDWVCDQRIAVAGIQITPERQPVTSDNQEVTVSVEVPATFAMTDLIESVQHDKISLTMAAAYVSDQEPLRGDGPQGRTWDVAQITINRRPSVAILTGSDGQSPAPSAQYFTNAETVLGRWMLVSNGPEVRDLRGAIAWLRSNAPSAGVPWGMVHIVGHSDGHVWLINRWPIEEIPDAAPRHGWQELDPSHVHSVASELQHKELQPLARHVASDSHVAFHICNFARDGDELLSASRALFAAAPQVHGPSLFVAFGTVDSGPQPRAGAVESVARLISSGSPAQYQTVEISPNVLLSANFRHI